MEHYRPRILDQILKEELEAMGAVLIEGPKACGKTTTAEQAAGSVIYMDDPVRRSQYLQMVETDISQILSGHTPRPQIILSALNSVKSPFFSNFA